MAGKISFLLTSVINQDIFLLESTYFIGKIFGEIEMLRLFYGLKELHFGNLMTLYTQSNQDNADELYGQLETGEALLKVEESFYHYLREDFFSVPGAVYAVWEEGGVYISALRMEPYQDGLLLEALETHPSFRKKGYARNLICAVLDHFKQQGRTVIYSHIVKQNTASLKTHETCGFHKFSDHAVYIDGSVTHNAYTMKLVIEQE